MTQVKFCKDCRWCVLGTRIYYDQCECPDSYHSCCLTERELGDCGPEAKYFEKRLTWWERLKEKMK